MLRLIKFDPWSADQDSCRVLWKCAQQLLTLIQCASFSCRDGILPTAATADTNRNRRDNLVANEIGHGTCYTRTVIWTDFFPMLFSHVAHSSLTLIASLLPSPLHLFTDHETRHRCSAAQEYRPDTRASTGRNPRCRPQLVCRYHLCARQS